MTTRDFCYWLQGFFELNKPETLNKEQTEEIRKHLYNVFIHECEKVQIPKNFDNIQYFASPDKINLELDRKCDPFIVNFEHERSC